MYLSPPLPHSPLRRRRTPTPVKRLWTISSQTTRTTRPQAVSVPPSSSSLRTFSVLNPNMKSSSQPWDMDVIVRLLLSCVHRHETTQIKILIKAMIKKRLILKSNTICTVVYSESQLPEICYGTAEICDEILKYSFL